MLSLADNITRAINFVFLVIVLGLTGSLIQSQDGGNSRVNFALFAAVFGLVTSSIYGLLANFVEALAWPVILVTLDALNFIFTLAAGAALATGMRVHSCSNQTYLDFNAITQGSSDRCRKGQAATAFLFFSFALFLVSLVLSIRSVMMGGAFGSRGSGRKSAGVPTISA